jgi:hypothetical protein
MGGQGKVEFVEEELDDVGEKCMTGGGEEKNGDLEADEVDCV